MKDSYTHITLVVDRSGSMQSIASDAQGGINKFVIDQKAVPGEATFYLCDFDDIHQEVFGPDDIKNFTTYTLTPRGSTALYDAFGKAIVKTGEYLKAMDESVRPAKVVFCVVTDGGENSSREWTKAKVKELVDKQTNDYKWEFVFIGANIDASAVGGNIGVRNTTQYAATGMSTRGVYANFSETVSQYRGAGAQAVMGSVKSVDKDGNDVDDQADTTVSNNS